MFILLRWKFGVIFKFPLPCWWNLPKCVLTLYMWHRQVGSDSGNWWKVLNAGNLFLPGVSVIYWIFVMQRYAPQSNRDELLAKSAEDWFPYWNSTVRYCQPSCVCENLQFESIYKCAIYIKTRCLYLWDTARNSPKFHNSSLNKVINCGAPFLHNHQLRVFCLARMKIFYFMTSVQYTGPRSEVHERHLIRFYTQKNMLLTLRKGVTSHFKRLSQHEFQKALHSVTILKSLCCLIFLTFQRFKRHRNRMY